MYYENACISLLILLFISFVSQFITFKKLKKTEIELLKAQKEINSLKIKAITKKDSV